jgi:hypothetical protein
MVRITPGFILATLILAAPALAHDSRGQSAGRPEAANPACSLLTDQEIRMASGRDYRPGSPGDELGEGAGGGASCQWGGSSFTPGESRPLLSLVFIPPSDRGSYTEGSLKMAPRKGCTRETLPGVGDVAFVESCERGRGPAAYVKAGPNDLIVQADPEEGKPPASARAVVVAVAKAAAAKARDK